jgi:Fic family protein
MIIQRGLKSEQRILHLKKLFEKYKILSRCQIMEITNINPITASKDLQKLCEQGFIIKRTPTKSRRSNYYEII